MPRAFQFPLVTLLLLIWAVIPTQVYAKTIMIIAPHPDDEVLISSGIIRRAIAAGDIVKVVIVTNGDSAGDVVGLTRQSESVAGLALLGLAEDNIIFLGYGDASLAEILDHASATQVIVSDAGRSATYGNRGLGGVDYHTFVHGTAGPYNRVTLQDDVRSVINTYRPAEIYVPGLHDRHSDHHGTYILAVEALTGLIRSGVTYSPIVFEGLIHAPCNGPCNMATLWPLPPFTPWAPFPKPVDLDITPLTWSWIQSFTVPAEMLSTDPTINLKLRAIARHATQASDFLNAFVKSNEFFWRHDFSNLALTATVTASAELASTRQTRDRAVDGLVSGAPNDPVRSYREWVAPGQTAGAWIQLTWASALQVGQIRLYDRPHTSENILSGTLTFSDGSTIAVGALPSQGAGHLITFPARTTTSLTFRIDAAEGASSGLAEIEVFGPTTPVPTNGAPVITTPASASPSIVADNQSSVLSVGASDPDGNVLLYTWTASNGLISGNGATVSFLPPLVSNPTDMVIEVTVSDPIGAFVRSQTIVRVYPSFARNIAGLSAVAVSSENAADGQLGVKAIDGVIDGYAGIPGDYTREWATLGERAGAFIRLTWSSVVTINEVRLYDRPNSTDRILSGVLDMSDGTTISVPSLPNNGAGLTVPVPGRTVSWIRLTVTSAAGGNTGLAEIEVIGGLGTPSTVPQPFAFAAQTNVYPAVFAVSEAVTVRGTNQPVSISVSAGEYSVAGGSYTSAPGTVLESQTVRLRQMASANSNVTTVATVTIGGVSADFSVTTGDITPDPFAFTSQQNVARSALVVSNAVTVQGTTLPAPISVVGGEYSIGTGAFTAIAGMVAGGQTVRVRQTSSANFDTTTTATLTIGGVAAGFAVRTLVGDVTPDPFAFTPQVNVARGSTVTSNSITVSGINGPSPISVVGGLYSISGGTFTSTSSTISNGQTVRVRLTSSSQFSTTTIATLTIGGVSAPFSVTTLAADTTPNSFSFPSKTGVALGSLVTSTSVKISGINTAAAISVSNGEYRINNGSWTSTPGTITNNQSVQVRHTAASTRSTSKTTTLTIGGVAGTFSSTTVN